MANIKFGAIATEIRGSVGGTTFQGNRYGFTIKNKPVVLNGNSALQQSRKTALSTISKFWGSMLETFRNSWDSYASAYPQYPKSGSTAALSGYAIFQKFNLYRLSIGMDVLEIPIGGLVAVPTYSVGLNNSSGSLDLHITASDSYPGHHWVASLSFPRSNNSAPSLMRTKFLMYGIPGSTTVDITDLYKALFGSLPVSGSYVKVDIREISDEQPILTAIQSFIVQVS